MKFPFFSTFSVKVFDLRYVRKARFFSCAILVGGLLVGCAEDEARSEVDEVDEVAQSEQVALTPNQNTFKIQPLGVNSSCMGSFVRHVRDHRTTPPTVYDEYMLGMKDCSPPASTLVVNMLGGQPWVGGASYVTIKKNGLCLTNPVQYSPNGTDKGETFWKPCIPQLSSTPERHRQQWYLKFNHINALQIISNTGPALGQPNSQVQCLDRVTPQTVKRGPCQLHNWQIVRAN